MHWKEDKDIENDIAELKEQTTNMFRDAFGFGTGISAKENVIKDPIFDKEHFQLIIGLELALENTKQTLSKFNGVENDKTGQENLDKFKIIASAANKLFDTIGKRIEILNKSGWQKMLEAGPTSGVGAIRDKSKFADNSKELKDLAKQLADLSLLKEGTEFSNQIRYLSENFAQSAETIRGWSEELRKPENTKGIF